MLNYIWGIMIIVGIIVGVFTGRIEEVTQSIINSSREAVNLVISMLGIIATWTGIMKVAEKAGIIDDLSNKMKPLLKWLFPEIPPNHKVNKYIATNIIANVLGLGWAATPAGLMAMKELQTLNKNKQTASNSMCMFIIINISSIQLLSINIIAYRTQYGANDPTDIILPTLIATTFSTIIAIIFAKFEGRRYKQ